MACQWFLLHVCACVNEDHDIWDVGMPPSHNILRHVGRG